MPKFRRLSLRYANQFFLEKTPAQDASYSEQSRPEQGHGADSGTVVAVDLGGGDFAVIHDRVCRNCRTDPEAASNKSPARRCYREGPYQERDAGCRPVTVSTARSPVRASGPITPVNTSELGTILGKSQSRTDGNKPIRHKRDI